jgi:hypothetical protein
VIKQSTIRREEHTLEWEMHTQLRSQYLKKELSVDERKIFIWILENTVRDV